MKKEDKIDNDLFKSYLKVDHSAQTVPLVSLK